MSIGIRINHWSSPTRPCDFSLGLQEDCVFADFNIDANGLVYLVGISFDGYGYCGVNDSTRTMTLEDSRQVVKWVESENVNHDEMSSILTNHFRRNKDLLWEDALSEHGLI